MTKIKSLTLTNFGPFRGTHKISFSTDSEINYEYYKKLQPYISSSYVIQYDSGEGKTVIQNGYFFNSKGEKIEV